MVAVRAPFGFKPNRNVLGGTFNPTTVRYRVLGTGRSNSVFPGDPVVRISGMEVRPLVSPVTASNVDRYVGIVAQCLDTNQKPLVFSQPTRGPFLPPATAGFVDVYTDKNNTYWAATDATASPAVVGTFAIVTAASSGTFNNLVGRSPLCINVADVSATAVATHAFFVIGPSMTQRDHLTQNDWTDGVEVRFASSNVLAD